MQEDMIGLTTDELMICHVIAQALPLHAPHNSCQCRNEDTCGYCRFVAAGVWDHLVDSGYQIARADAGTEWATECEEFGCHDTTADPTDPDHSSR